MCVCGRSLTSGCSEVGGVDLSVIYSQLLSTDSERTRVMGTAVGHQLRLQVT